MNVLIVDDQPEVVESMAAGVNWTRLGAENVFTAYSVKEAQGVFERDRIDILLCDIEMPPTNGFALLRWVQERFSGVVCIFLTAHAEFEYAQEAVKLGRFDYTAGKRTARRRTGPSRRRCSARWTTSAATSTRI